MVKFVSTPVFNNPQAALARALIWPVAKWYFGYVIDKANDIAYERGDMGHTPGQYILPFYQTGIDFYP